MKYSILIVLFFLINLKMYSQDISTCMNLKFNNTEEIDKSSDCIIILCDSMLTLPIEKFRKTQTPPLSIILDWQKEAHRRFKYRETEDFVFMKKKHIEMPQSGMFFLNVICAIKSGIENQANYKENAFAIYINYIRDPKHNITLNKKMLKMISDSDRGKIKKYISK